MHPNRKFHIEERAEMAAMVRALGFGIVFVQAPEGPRSVHVPVLVEGERLLFHVSRRNLVHDALMAGATALFVASGPHAYISPDWYGLEGRVATWNYLAVELEGPVRPLDREATIRLLDALSAEHEAQLAPKPAWTRDRISAELFENLLKAITAFEMNITAWRGTAKVDQDKPPEVRARVAAALEVRGDAAMAEVMRPVLPAAAGRGEGVGALDCPQQSKIVSGGHDLAPTHPKGGGGADSAHSPSTAFHAVPLPIRFADRED